MLSTTFRAAALALTLGTLAACSSSPDGSMGNPPGTAVSRANDRAGDPLNTAGRPDGTMGNPPGTAVSRALGTTDPAPRASTRRSRRMARAQARRNSATRAGMRRPASSGPGVSTPSNNLGSTPPGGSPTTLSTQGS